MASILDNVIVQGPNSPNRSIISFSTESVPYPGSALLVRGNTIENFGGRGIAVLNRSGLSVTFTGNKIFALTTIVSGLSTQADNTILQAPVVLDTTPPWRAPGPVR